MKRPLLSLKFALLAMALPMVAQAQLSVEITGAGANRFPLAIPDFSGERIVSQAITSVVRTDLERSGVFRLVDPGPGFSEATNPPYADLRARGADAVAYGSIAALPDGRYETRARVADVQKQAALGSDGYAHSAGQMRAIGHRISDFVYEKLTGERGIFSTKIAYVVKGAGRYELQIADADGGNAQSALNSREPIISPMWSPDGAKLAYVSFESKKPVIWIHDLATGYRHVAANFKGSNSAPAWAPDGRRLAIVLTKDGNSQLYLVNLDGSGVSRLTSSNGIDTEPRFSPDGAHVYFTSDRGGSPQIYRVATAGGQAERVTFEGAYNVTPRPSPDGKSLAFITRNNGRFQLALMDLGSKQVQVLTDSAKDESPSFAPNGRMIIYATEVGGRGVLAAVSADGRVKQRLSGQAGDVREPSWGPLPR